MPNPFTVVFALYPNITQLDFTGPFRGAAALAELACDRRVSGGR